MLLNYFFQLSNKLSPMILSQIASGLLNLLGLLKLLAVLLEEVSVVACARCTLLAQQVKHLDNLFPSLYLSGLLLLDPLVLFEFSINLTLLGILYSTVAVLDLFALFLLAVTDFLLLTELLSFFFLFLPPDSRVSLVSQLHQLYDSCTFLLKVLIPATLVLLFHVPALVPVLCLPGIVLIVLREISP